MVKPAYAERYCFPVPGNIRTVAPFHALGPDIKEDELRKRLLAVPFPNGRKRVRFNEEEGDLDDSPPHKRHRSD